jgi:hypothetical protein
MRMLSPLSLRSLLWKVEGEKLVVPKVIQKRRKNQIQISKVPMKEQRPLYHLIQLGSQDGLPRLCKRHKEQVGAPKTSFQGESSPKKFPNYVALMSSIIDSKPSKF